MTQRFLLQIQILEKLGAPLLAAASEVLARQQDGEGQARKQEAEMVAEMMGKAVQASVALSGNMDMKDAGAQGDSIRLALAAMAGQMIAGQCRVTGKIPLENDIKRMLKALEAVLAFSDNFTPATENAARLEALSGDSRILDENQAQIQYMMAFIPVVNAVAAFSFGRPENRLSQEIADRIVRKAQAIQKTIAAGAGAADRKTDISLLPGLCRLYAECHREETAKLMGLDAGARAKMAETAGGLLPMESVWRSFDMKAAMLEALSGSAPRASGASTGVSAPAAAAQPPLPSSSPFASFAPAQAAPENQPPAAVQPPPQPPAPDAEPASAGGAYSPMGFFKAKPKSQDEDGGQGGS